MTMATSERVRRIGIDWDRRRAYKKAYYQANKNAIAIRVKAKRENGQEDRRAYLKAWHEKNKEHCQIKGQAYRQTSEYKERHKLYQRDWRARTPDLQARYGKKYYQANSEKHKAYSKKWIREKCQRDHVAALKGNYILDRPHK